MQTLEEQFNTRLNAFLGSTGLRPTTLGMKAVGDPSLLRQIERGRSPSLRTADRILAFMAAYEQDSGGPPTPPRGHRRRKPSSRARRTRRSRAMSEQPIEQRTNAPIRFLRISAVEALTGLSRTTIYDWSAQGRFPRAVRLSERAVRWIESEVEEWMDERIEQGRGGDASHGRTGVRKRRGGPMRTLALRRCARVLRSKPRHGNVLRLRGRVGQRRTGSTDRDGSDPPVQGPGTGSGPGVFAHPCPRPLGSLPIHQSLRGKAV